MADRPGPGGLDPDRNIPGSFHDRHAGHPSSLDREKHLAAPIRVLMGFRHMGYFLLCVFESIDRLAEVPGDARLSVPDPRSMDRSRLASAPGDDDFSDRFDLDPAQETGPGIRLVGEERRSAGDQPHLARLHKPRQHGYL